MKRRLLYSAIIGFVLVLLSLFYKTGSPNLEPMPYINDGGRPIVNGVVLVPPNPSGPTDQSALAKRGLLLPVVSIRSDDDRVGNYYKSLIIGNLIFDYLFFTLVSFGFLSLFAMAKRPGPPSS